MHTYNHHLILPTLRATLPCCQRQEVVCIGGGRPPAEGWLSGLVTQGEKSGTDRPVWAIDRGVSICRAVHLPPALLIGDGDSADRAAWAWGAEKAARVHSFPPEKDDTDTALALHIASEEALPPLLILTASFGGRLDHLMSTAAVAAHSSVPCVLADERESLFYLHDGETLHITCKNPPRAISLLPFTEECTGITTEGLYWELTNAHISNHTSLAVSNVLARNNSAKVFTVSIEHGVLGVYLCHIE